MSSGPSLTPAQSEALQARFALRVTARLDDAARDLPHDIGERLRVARQQAVAAALQARRGAVAVPAAEAATASLVVTTPGVALAGGLGAAPAPSLAPASPAAWATQTSRQRGPGHGRPLDDAPPSWAWRIASALPALALVAGLWGIADWTKQEQVQAATDVDMALLTDDLPPTAYADPGFEEFLRAEEPVPPAPVESATDTSVETATSDELAGLLAQPDTAEPPEAP